MKKMMDVLEDRRSSSLSVLTLMNIPEYIALVQNAYWRGGGLEGQREPLKTTSALKIRKRMVEDFNNGAILPPVVIGWIVPSDVFAQIPNWSKEHMEAQLAASDPNSISIIDGMQRTTAFIDNAAAFADRDIRVEFWVATETTSLTYRMLILNTTQVPWNLRRQIEVVRSPIITELRNNISQRFPELVGKFNVYELINRETHHRTLPGEFLAFEVAEMYLAFGLRNPKVDADVVLTGELSRLDLIEAMSSHDFTSLFTSVFAALVRLDYVFGRFPCPQLGFGKYLFDSHPACIGFITAAAQRVLGRPGAPKRDASTIIRPLKTVEDRCRQVEEILSGKTKEELIEFLCVDVLNEQLMRISSARTKIGDTQRQFFTEAFRLFLLEAEEVDSMETCWRADETK